MSELVYPNTTNGSSGNSSLLEDESPQFEHIFLFLLLVFFSVVTILGNLLVSDSNVKTWHSGQRHHVILQQSEFESSWQLIVSTALRKDKKINSKSVCSWAI